MAGQRVLLSDGLVAANKLQCHQPTMQGPAVRTQGTEQLSALMDEVKVQ
jgi:hypothetical protein